MNTLKIMFLATTALLFIESSTAQVSRKVNNTTQTKKVSTFETTEETIAKINKLMNAESDEVPVKETTPKKRIVVNGPVKTATSSSPRLPLNSVTTLNSNNISYMTEQLLNVAKDYEGTRYSWGGMSRRGMDCSGFVKTAFSQFNIDLPRTSKEMASLGNEISTKDAKPGDLVFFKNGGSRVINHVGIVVDVKEDEIIFIHSASSKGVSINSTKEAYYKKGFVKINRVYDQQIL